MTLAAKAAGEPPSPHHGLPCSIGVLLGALPTAEADGLRTMLDDRRWSENSLTIALKDEGHAVGRQSIGRHRRKQCRCFR